MNIRNIHRHVASAAAALLISAFFITAAVGPAVSQASGTAAAEAQRGVA